MLEISEFTIADRTPWTETAMAQEREFYKYCQLPQRPGLLHRPPPSPRTEIDADELLPQSSHDTTLTALAQLGALRLNAQRCMISLFDRHTQYILAESTRTLSLQDDRVHVEGDALWLGSSVIAKPDGICHYVCEEDQLNVGYKESDDKGRGPCALVIPDMTQDDRCRQRQYVINAPHLRFYAGVPIMSRRGIAIGAFAVSDGKTRAGLNSLEVRFMVDTAIAIMNHLEMVRSHEQNRRGANMISGLGSFVEGATFPSSSLRRSRFPSDEGDAQRSTEIPGVVSHMRRHHQARPEHRPVFKDRMQDKEPIVLQSTSSESRQTLPWTTSTPKPPRQPEVTLASGTREIIGRAARVLQSSLEVEGVVFFDASVNSYAALVQNADDRHSDLESGSCSSSSCAMDSTSSSSDSDNPTMGHSSTETDDSAVCEVLGHSAFQDDFDGSLGSMRESFLRSMLRNYPRGAIFNIDENGGVSSSEGSDSASGSSVTREIIYRRYEGSKVQRQWKQRKRDRLSIKEENRALIKIFPSARCVTLFPLWDSRRNRWFSGLFVWTSSPRVFSLSGELAYLYAFSNSIMSEVHRLDIELANKAHATLVGSISHELRSPLHGILGSTELLCDSSMTPAQVALVNTIEHCGRSLLDIINNMLDFAKINQFTRKSRSSRLKSSRPSRRRPALPGRTLSKDKPNLGVVNLISDVQLDAVLEEVIDSVFAGHCFSAKSGLLARGVPPLPISSNGGDLVTSGATQQPLSAFNESLTVIYDVEPAARWLFETQAGAWRRIIMNLFGNALKYTSAGYIWVSLRSGTTTTTKARPPSRADGSREEMGSVTLTVKDTGQGIEKEYLQSNIFKPFSQEDSLSPGSGLGLSIVHQTVLSLGGKVEIISTKGSGTEVTVAVDLPRTPRAEPIDTDRGISIVRRAKDRVRGKSIGLIGFGKPSREEDEASSLLRPSLMRMFKDHFGMDVGLVSNHFSDPQPYDLYLVRQANLDEVDQICQQVTMAESDSRSPPMIVICSTPQMAQKLSASASQRPSSSIYEFISQPCGPPKMAASLLACLKRQKDRQARPVSSMEPNMKPPVPITTAMLAAHQASQTIQQNEGASRVDFSLTPNKATVSLTTSDVDDSIVEVSTVEVAKSVPSVLLVDDNDVNLKLLIAFMKKAKFPYLTASNGLEALEAYKAHFPQVPVVLMDISMPVMDGLESSREIRLFEQIHHEGASNAGHSPSKPTTIIALSGLGSAPVRQEAFNSGVDLFLSKPIRFQELVKQIDHLMR